MLEQHLVRKGAELKSLFRSTWYRVRAGTTLTKQNWLTSLGLWSMAFFKGQRMSCVGVFRMQQGVYRDVTHRHYRRFNLLLYDPHLSTTRSLRGSRVPDDDRQTPAGRWCSSHKASRSSKCTKEST